jgi:hypothetical protein
MVWTILRELRGRCVKAAVVFISTALALAGAAVLLASPASARSGEPRQGKGYAVGGGDFVGYYLTTSDRKIYCLSPSKALPTTISLDRVEHFAGVSKAKSQQLAYALGRWGNADTARTAAAESQVLNTIVGNKSDVARRAKQLPKNVATLVHAHLAEVHRYYGSYVTTVRTPHALLPGQQSVGTVVITSTATGRRVPHVSVQLHGTSNVAVAHHLITDRKGVGRFTYRVTDTGEVHISAKASGLPATALLANHPAPDAQHMVSPVHTVSTQGSASFRKSPAGFAHKYACTTTCNGRPTTEVSACAPASSRASRIVYHYGRKAAVLTFPASTSKTCKTATIITHDGQHVWARWQFKTAHGWSTPVRARGSFTVDCPPAPRVGITMIYNCSHASLAIGLAKFHGDGTWTPLVNQTSHRLVLVIGGATSKRIFAARGKSALFTTTASCDAPRTYTMQAGVQRANGHYNYGAIGSVTTPGPPA